jgi:S-formylglutathione hydrolase
MTRMRSVASLLLLIPAFLFSQSADRHGTVERVKVHGKSLEGNLEGDSPDRDVSVYLPPSYESDTSRRYPVVYMLHGYTDDDAKWFGLVKHWISLPAVVDQAFANPDVREMIFVMPDAYTRYQGSMYSTSATTGDWENYVAQELVAYVDSHYRTLASVNSRGIAGHSMGGYGAMRIGMKHPNVFSSVYLLSPCCLMPGEDATRDPDEAAKAEAITSVADFEKAGFMTKIFFASAAAWSPNPNQPPLYLDLPMKDGKTQRQIAAKWAANLPLAMIDQYIPDIRRLHAIAFDAGTGDQPIASTIQVLDAVLTSYKIPHQFETYEGDHLNRIAERIRTKMLPFFSTNLQQ